MLFSGRCLLIIRRNITQTTVLKMEALRSSVLLVLIKQNARAHILEKCSLISTAMRHRSPVHFSRSVRKLCFIISNGSELHEPRLLFLSEGQTKYSLCLSKRPRRHIYRITEPKLFLSVIKHQTLKTYGRMKV